MLNCLNMELTGKMSVGNLLLKQKEILLGVPHAANLQTAANTSETGTELSSNSGVQLSPSMDKT